MSIFVELSLIVVLASLISFVLKLFRQPLVVGYIVAGIVVGPYFFNILQAHDEVELFAKIGVAILLFIVGLALNPDVMREVGKVSLITGVGQVVFTSLIGFFIAIGLGFSVLTSFYIAIALTFSSTIIILKLLSDRGDTQRLYGKISIGFLLVQDVVAVILLLVITVLGGTALTNISSLSLPIVIELIVLLAKGALTLLLLYLVSRYLLPKVARFMAEYQEVLFIFSLAWGLGISALFFVLGFSIEIGALAAGVTLAASPFAYEIGSRMKPLRDFFIMLFFVLLGSQIIFSQIAVFIVPAIALSLFVLIGNPLIVIFLMNLLGYRTRIAFMAGLTVAQISEFSLILVALGYSFGHLSQEVVSLVTLVGVITISGSTYLILYADRVYAKSKWFLKFFTIRKNFKEIAVSGNEVPDVVILGYDRVGYDFVKVVKEITSNFLVIDFNPQTITKLASKHIPHRYGDADDIEFLQEIGLAKAKLVVSTVPELKTNMLLVNYYRSRNPEGIIVTIAHSIDNTKELYNLGASYVVMPHHLGATKAASLISTLRFDQDGFAKEKLRHLDGLAKRIQDDA